MLDLATPTDHAGAYEWLVVLMAHGGVGLVATACLSAVLRSAWIAWGLVFFGYGIAWEGAVQGYGAGIGDAAVDTFAVAAGGLIGWLAWARRGGLMAIVLVIFAAVGAIGVRARK